MLLKQKRGKMQKRGKAQVSIEYLIIVGFVTFVVMAILGIAFYYSGTMKGKIKENQITDFANKIISTSESVYYSGAPSKATISCYLPDNVKSITIGEYDLIIEFSTSSGVNKIAFSSRVPISGTLTTSQGLKKIQIEAQSDRVIISQA